MAKLTGPFDFNGSLSHLTFYRRRDSDKIITRQKAGPTKEQISKAPQFALTRKNCTEWEGCAKASMWLRRVLLPLDSVRDYNLAGTLTGLFKSIQKLDTESLYGQRSVQLSKHPNLLEGFTLSRQTPFDTVVRTPLTGSVDKDTLSAHVRVPELRQGINFSPYTPHPYFRISASLGIVPDLHYTPNGYTTEVPPVNYSPIVMQTEWRSIKKGLPETGIELSLPYPVEYPSYALVLAVALCLGTPDGTGTIQAVKYCGSGQILAICPNH